MAIAKKRTEHRAAIKWSTPAALSRRYGHLNIWGPGGTGKSHLAATAPGPVGVIDLDLNFDRVIANFPGADFRAIPIRYVAGHDKEGTQGVCKEAWFKLEAHMEDAVKWAGSTVVDTETEMWELLRLADHGTGSPRGRRMDRLWGPTNATMMRMLRLWKASRTNLITVSLCGDQYKEIVKDGDKVSTKTGKFERKGFSRLEYTVDVAVQTLVEDGEFKAEVMLNKFDVNMQGMIVEGEDLSFAGIMGLCSGMDPDEWTKGSK